MYCIISFTFFQLFQLFFMTTGIYNYVRPYFNWMLIRFIYNFVKKKNKNKWYTPPKQKSLGMYFFGNTSHRRCIPNIRDSAPDTRGFTVDDICTTVSVMSDEWYAALSYAHMYTYRVLCIYVLICFTNMFSSLFFSLVFIVIDIFCWLEIVLRVCFVMHFRNIRNNARSLWTRFSEASKVSRWRGARKFHVIIEKNESKVR